MKGIQASLLGKVAHELHHARSSGLRVRRGAGRAFLEEGTVRAQKQGNQLRRETTSVSLPGKA